MENSGIRRAGRRARRALVLGSVWSGFVLSACESGDPGSSTEIFCTAMCERSVQCDGWDSVGTCEHECQSEPGDLEAFRPEFIAKFSSCLRRLSCSDFFTENSFEPCWDEAREGFEPTAETRAFCSGYSRTWFECGVFYFPDECERDWALRAAVSLDRVAQCDGSVACDALEACIDAAIEAGR